MGVPVEDRFGFFLMHWNLPTDINILAKFFKLSSHKLLKYQIIPFVQKYNFQEKNTLVLGSTLSIPSSRLFLHCLNSSLAELRPNKFQPEEK